MLSTGKKTQTTTQEVRAEIIHSLKNTYVLTAVQQCCHSRKTSVEETDSDLKKKKEKNTQGKKKVWSAVWTGFHKIINHPRVAVFPP